jgi:hypothetical protein
VLVFGWVVVVVVRPVVFLIGGAMRQYGALCVIIVRNDSIDSFDSSVYRDYCARFDGID